MNPWEEFTGVNAGYVFDLYQRYQNNPASVDDATRPVFARWTPEIESEPSPDTASLRTTDLTAAIATFNLAESIRRFGHLAARLDPLGFTDPVGDPSLLSESHGLTKDTLARLPASIVAGPAAGNAANAFEAVEQLRGIYCATAGHDYNHVFVPEERVWLREAVEARRFRPPIDPINARELLDRITQVEVFERFLHRAFPGKTRFSIEGLDMMIPILDEIINDAAAAGVAHVMIAMAHRGRLNVLAHILQKSYEQILGEFKDPLFTRSWRIDLGWMGDVKYHAGARYELDGTRRQSLVITMPPNPSHLEAVDPVLHGMARAAAAAVDAAGEPRLETGRVLAIIIHGDAAFPGQGVVAETLNLSRLEGYQVGGMIHIIANNQLGFTATPKESYSTSYASGLARGFKIPIVHVNADDPVACIEAARLSWAYRHKFKLDFLIDLVGYRRYGHNEGDEPSFTQPEIYQIVARHPTVREQYADQLVTAGEVPQELPGELVKRHHSDLERAYSELKPDEEYMPPLPNVPPSGAARRAQTGVSLERLVALNRELLALPEGFTVHRKLERARERRAAMLDQPIDRTIDWSAAEELALGSILEDGIPIRFTGEDVERGTFSHRHAVLHDSVTGAKHIPLASFPRARASFEIHNSPLSENAALGFEFGYSIQAQGRFVLWEAQYGDFINGAQVVLDEFVTSGRAKWGLSTALTMLLPHGYEGQGPDHSSARLERFLEGAADLNMRIANCTTAAQYFHLLRRQALLLTTDPLPLVILTPKSLLRHPLTASAPRELTDGRFQFAIDDDEARRQPGDVRRLLLCSGKIYVDLVSSEQRKNSATDVALVRLEQLYPFPSDEIAQLVEQYSRRIEICWVQEEPENMGAWHFVQPLLEELVDGRCALRYIGRPRHSSPAEGSSAWHAVNQRAIIAEAFERKADAHETDRVLSKQV